MSAMWKTQDIQQSNGKAERIKLPAKFQIVTESWNRVVALPYIVCMPEKDRVLMVVTCDIPLTRDSWVDAHPSADARQCAATSARRASAFPCSCADPSS